ncbi:Glycosyltransferase involved in cell wall bisynthesis [Butyrivibrio proteoclasticus]|uniref:Glycosyltransferase involved in cell wall bisynthesis n=1 Tax=Butyrivibrio proteoclasticus TaxID=43305 RepID=A0A1I5Y5L0_9FIRM|nr:glycosyltransferase family 2 protein [Butyrivibrio proteoclasticus]SFQ39522.1 Glycosyltransferase involved in cell wall bisynthesis [Butyrivibrio proteoclasticus]
MKKISVIVGAYNAHSTLVRCLTSLINQTLEDIEIIVVNDASKDDTWEIMKRCEEQFPDKVKIVNNEVNLGCGGARNIGLNFVEGEYIGFCDSDDYIASNMYELLYEKAKEKDADIVDCGFFAEAAGASSISTPESAEGELDAEKRKTLILLGGYLVTKLFKRELFFDPPIKMRNYVRTLSDNDILKYMCLRARNIWAVRQVLYYYSDAPGSDTKIVDLDRYYGSIYGVIDGTYKLCHKLPDYESCKEVIEYAQVNWYSYGINRCLYDQIAKYGADEKNINLFFENVGEKEKGMLEKLAKLKNRVVTCSYRENDEIMSKIAELDIKIMEECDKRYG